MRENIDTGLTQACSGFDLEYPRKRVCNCGFERKGEFLAWPAFF